MSIGKIKNRYCPHGCRIIKKDSNNKDVDLGPQKYKKCCWDKDYWNGFSKSVSEITVKEKLHGKPVEYKKEVIRYFKIPTI